MGTGMCQHEVLASGFSDNAWIGLIPGYVLSDGLPHVLEHTCGPCEVDTAEVGVLQNDSRRGRAIRVDEVDHTGRQTGFFEYLHDDSSRVDLRLCRFPDHGVAHECRGCGKITGDGGEVERCNSKHEALEWTVFHAVPHTGLTIRLIGIDLSKVLNVEPEKVDQLAGAVNFCLEGVLALCQHRCRIHLCPVGACQQIGRLQENGCSFLPRHVFPVGLSRKGGINSHGNMCRITMMVVSQQVVQLMGWPDGMQVTGGNPFPADHHRQFHS